MKRGTDQQEREKRTEESHLQSKSDGLLVAKAPCIVLSKDRSRFKPIPSIPFFAIQPYRASRPYRQTSIYSVYSLLSLSISILCTSLFLLLFLTFPLFRFTSIVFLIITTSSLFLFRSWSRYESLFIFLLFLLSLLSLL